ncbi:major histocompatibility complex class I-related gene protein-like [Bufo bufo]|uniref:major histocompatibility complex class I-related gene protein-like n=1 Tax=Bufo bufo TaxID=8384 RepID=UPI001ABDCF4F|nr:major histocompatibility complex class I-related gene protein-like [Bufo bufo]
MTRCALLQVLLLLLSARFAFSGVHTHYFYTTITNDLTSNIPYFMMTRTLDGVTLFWYDSDNEVVERRVPWFKSRNQTLLDASISYYSVQRNWQNFLHNVSNVFNHAERYHVLQILQGCTLYDNGTFQAAFTLRYDGKPLMSFNVETARLIAESPEAEEFVENFNSNATILQENKFILLNMCTPHITELLSLGNCTFNRKEAPVVKVTQVPKENAGVKLYCRAYGHYPKDIFIMWYKNGHQISEMMMEKLTLPLPDLTYLTSLSFNVSAVADDVYTCKVNHSSMLLNFTQDLRISGDFESLSSTSSNPSTGAVIAICLAIILAITIIVFSSVSFLKRRRQ